MAESPQSFVRAHREGATGEVWGIGELARELDTTARAIRFYESKGLLDPQRVGATRVYGRRERARLQLILRAKSLGLSLREIKRYLDLYGERGEGRSKQLEMVVQRTGEMIAELEAKRAEIDKTLAELRHIRRESQKTLDARED
ncbi:MAG: MerR family DNA-binding transcriptional regulator [Hydrogenovibrio crunogenus]|nr:MerR family DNA-binding transcriptional regulator [Hydrogenovibrio crunogenus]RZO60245.1 MAG: MerR family DNA-binding transcriptional regulator [Sandaracinaceae bacterium]HBQ16652.1 MerR family transcriptional regulator [Myxococcales bacterium]